MEPMEEEVGRQVKFLPVESSSYNLQQCTQLPHEILQYLHPYRTSLEEFISIRVTSAQDNNVLQCPTRILARISAFTTNSNTCSDAAILSDVRVQEICVTEKFEAYILNGYPHLDKTDILIACSIKSMLRNYWDRYKNLSVRIPPIGLHEHVSEDPPARILKCGVIRCMTVTVIYEDLSQLGQRDHGRDRDHDQDEANALSKQLVKDSLKIYGVHVKANTVIDFRECPFLCTIPGKLSFIFVHECTLNNSQFEIGRVSNQTDVNIRRNHELSYFNRILVALSNRSESFPGLESASLELQSGFQIPLPIEPRRKHFYSGFLLGGPLGSGKKQLVLEIAKKYCAKLFTCNVGAQEQLILRTPKTFAVNLKRIFRDAEQSAINGYPVLILIENLDILRTNDTGTASRSVRKKNGITNLIAELLDHAGTDLRINVPFIVVATTSKPYLIPDKFRICHRLHREIFVNVPDLGQRIDILKSLQQETDELSLLNIEAIAKRTPGYVASDLNRLINLALLKAHESDVTKPSEKHIKYALSRVLPSVLQGGIGVISTHMTNGLEQISGLDSVKMKLVQTIVWPLTIPEALDRMGIRPPNGIILYGPSGCGKTSLVRAIASSHHTNFISVSSAELFSSGVGDSEKIIAHLFHMARQASPCVLFIDELDAIVGSRETKSSSGKPVNDMILSMLLTEMDGIGQTNSFSSPGSQKNISTSGRRYVVVGATNRPEMIDPALLRPGRFDRLVPVYPPNESDRLKLLENCTRNTKLSEDVSFSEISEKTERFSGADIVNLCREAGLLALSENIDASCVSMKHYQQALSNCSPSISQKYLNSFYEYASQSNDMKTLSSQMSSLRIP